jgi:hypothetical protein
MNIKGQIAVIDGKAQEINIIEKPCCNEMEAALLKQEASISVSGKMLWLSCPFCKEDIEYI